jgi:hypothetical protein
MLHQLVADTMADVLAFMQVKTAAIELAAEADDDVNDLDAQPDDDPLASTHGVSVRLDCTSRHTRACACACTESTLARAPVAGRGCEPAVNHARGDSL